MPFSTGNESLSRALRGSLNTNEHNETALYEVPSCMKVIPGPLRWDLAQPAGGEPPPRTGTMNSQRRVATHIAPRAVNGRLYLGLRERRQLIGPGGLGRRRWPRSLSPRGTRR